MTHLLAFLLLATSAHAADLKWIAKIDAIEGPGQVVVVHTGAAHKGAKGAPLYEGDALATASKVAVAIAYKDGSRQLLAPGSRIILHMVGDVPAPEFVEGAVDSRIKPAEKASPKPRFLFRSKSVVLGVRGTEFVVHTGPHGLEVHTLKGVVEAVHAENEFGTDKAIQIKEAFEVVGIGGPKIPAPSAFVPAEFVGKVVQKYPELGKLLKN